MQRLRQDFVAKAVSGAEATPVPTCNCVMVGTLGQMRGERILNVLSTAKGAITWLGGAIAGLTALCYGAGYFALHAYLALLGLDGIVPVKPDQMLLEGAEFWLTLVSQLLLYAALTVFILVLLIVPCLLLHHLPVIRGLTAKVTDKARGGWQWLGQRYASLSSVTALVVFLGLLAWHYDYFVALRSVASAEVPQAQSSPERHLAPLLFRSFDQPANSAASAKPPCNDPKYSDASDLGANVRNQVARGEECRDELVDANFNRFVRAYFILLLLVVLAFSDYVDRNVGRRTSIFIRAGAAVYFGIYTLGLPASYGVLVHEPNYPHVTLRGPNYVAEGYSLFQDDRSLLLWSPTERRTTWLPIQRVEIIQSDGPRNIFQKSEEKIP